MRGLLLLSRPGCDLCEQLEDELHRQFAGQFQLDWRDVDRDPDWRARYGQLIPVLLDEARQPLCAGVLDADAVRRYLSSAD